MPNGSLLRDPSHTIHHIVRRHTRRFIHNENAVHTLASDIFMCLVFSFRKNIAAKSGLLHQITSKPNPMIPIRDDAPRTTIPFITYFLIAMNTVVFLFELSLPSQVRAGFVYQFGVVPSIFGQALHNGALIQSSVVPVFTSM